ncbi:required for meiotic nuclear division protein 1 homolog isoform X3 [Panulirus ornatus]|uniref:required for meiotic nuclear division protein 1 homolog isoform X3 n=1 Tax=Panulirus ornatus TaxID=150431 RepID=UPI003A89A52E
MFYLRMAVRGIYGRILKSRSLIAEVLPGQVFSKSKHTSPHLSLLDTVTHKRTSNSVISPISCLSSRNYSGSSSSVSGRNGSFYNYPHISFARNICVVASRHGPSIQGICLLSVSADLAAANRKNLSTDAFPLKRHSMFGVFSGQSSYGSSTNMVNCVTVGSVTLPSGVNPSVRYISQSRNSLTNIHTRLSSLQAKKRVQRKKKQPLTDSEEAEEPVAGFAPMARHKFLTFDPDFTLPEMQVHKSPPREWQVTAYATADEYDLDKLLDGITHQGLYTAATINPDASDVLHMVATYQLESEHREIYFFREGSVVFWNVAELERTNVLRFIKQYEKGKYEEQVVEEECESLTYKYNEGPSKTRLVHDKIMLNPEGPTDMEKYTFSNVMAMSVKLGIWEASLDNYIDNIEYVSEELSKTGRVVLSQEQVLQRMGQLFALRHLLNLSSDLLDIPDFYWDHEQLEQLYKRTSEHLSISKRTSVMNVKLGHCVELMELLKGHLDEKHSSRLEWIIIILIMVEVGIELLHYLERLL